MWLILALGQELYKISPEHLTVPGSKETLKQNIQNEMLQKQTPKSPNRSMSTEQRSQLKELPVAQAGIVSASKEIK